MLNIMASKKFSKDDLVDTHGPMNSVSKEDALVYSGAPQVEHLSKLNTDKKREVLARKRKLVNASKKQERRISKNIIKNI